MSYRWRNVMSDLKKMNSTTDSKNVKNGALKTSILTFYCKVCSMLAEERG